jgi:hypothetical protein
MNPTPGRSGVFLWAQSATVAGERATAAGKPGSGRGVGRNQVCFLREGQTSWSQALQHSHSQYGWRNWPSVGTGAQTAASLRLPVRKNLSAKNKTRRLRHPCFQQFDLNPATMTLAGKSLFKLIVVLPRCPLALGSEGVRARFEDFQIYDTGLQQTWQMVQDVAPDERMFCEFAGALGLAPHDMNERTATRLDRLWKRLARSYWWICASLLYRIASMQLQPPQKAHLTVWVLRGPQNLSRCSRCPYP